MKAHNLLFFAILFVFLLSSCKKDTEGTLSLNFVATINEQPLVLNTKYPFQNGEIEFTMTNFYVSNVSVKETNQTSGLLVLKDVDLIKIGSNSTINFQLEEGNFESLSLGLGLDEFLDATDPSMYENNHPLGINQNNFWLMSNSYIYVKLEGYFHSNGITQNITYHLGDNSFYKTKTVNQPFSVVAKNTTTKTFVLSIEDVFEGIVIEDKLDTHTVGDLSFALQMMNNFEAALTLQ